MKIKKKRNLTKKVGKKRGKGSLKEGLGEKMKINMGRAGGGGMAKDIEKADWSK